MDGIGLRLVRISGALGADLLLVQNLGVGDYAGSDYHIPLKNIESASSSYFPQADYFESDGVCYRGQGLGRPAHRPMQPP